MKKIILSFVVVCAVTFASAQSNTAVSSTPTGLASGAQSSAAVSVTLHNAIQIAPATNWTYGALFMNAADYNSAMQNGGQLMGDYNWTIKSTKGGAISVGLTDLTSSSPSGAMSIPANKMSYSFDGSNFTAASNTFSGGTFGSGDNNIFRLALKLDPQWSHAGGFYGGQVTITATQQ